VSGVPHASAADDLREWWPLPVKQGGRFRRNRVAKTREIRTVAWDESLHRMGAWRGARADRVDRTVPLGPSSPRLRSHTVRRVPFRRHTLSGSDAWTAEGLRLRLGLTEPPGGRPVERSADQRIRRICQRRVEKATLPPGSPAWQAADLEERELLESLARGSITRDGLEWLIARQQPEVATRAAAITPPACSSPAPPAGSSGQPPVGDAVTERQATLRQQGHVVPT
jgi:hypothetical protein